MYVYTLQLLKPWCLSWFTAAESSITTTAYSTMCNGTSSPRQETRLGQAKVVIHCMGEWYGWVADSRSAMTSKQQHQQQDQQ